MYKREKVNLHKRFDFHLMYFFSNYKYIAGKLTQHIEVRYSSFSLISTRNYTKCSVMVESTCRRQHCNN